MSRLERKIDLGQKHLTFFLISNHILRSVVLSFRYEIT